ncbi:hypothetical protein GCM10023206_01360 [Acinetobacter puyangensis]|uniref:Uncharacterized protein n=1 Tax=Acinetobacter puyangensis TaxID=1096779 RepID=A0A240E6Y3_9GAMM|nr:hypothetical protein [Acinetobacter puyangensis]SNX44514.1 hypothetical protein SAMN05421731_103252 [Acinetobacter puyangensis]
MPYIFVALVMLNAVYLSYSVIKEKFKSNDVQYVLHLHQDVDKK